MALFLNDPSYFVNQFHFERRLSSRH